MSDAQIQSQIDVLNKDFRFLNADTLDGMHPYRSRAADTRIEFCLATRDPNGNPTTGITRTQTSEVAWNAFDEDEADNIKSSANGGKDNWDPTQYLNMYIVKFDSVLLGFATFPEELATSPNLDGVVIRYEAFGTSGTAGLGGFEKNMGGRTATHEVGHWLNLRHIWGDDSCGNDFVSDTESAEGANYGCPTFPHKASNSCGTGSDGEMFMNYMDDKCMNMFTSGQGERMTAAITGPRSGLLTSLGCQTPLSVENNSNLNEISIYPNPNNGMFTIFMTEASPKNINIKIENVLGKVVKEMNNISGTQIQVNLNNEFQPGAYFIRIDAGNNNVITKKYSLLINTNKQSSTVFH